MSGYPAKLMNLQALLAKVEATYGVAVAVAATADGQLLAISDRYPGLASLRYSDNGDMGPSPGNLGGLRRVGSVGRSIVLPVTMRFKGGGTTYATTVTPNIDTFLQIGGLTPTLAGGAYTYVPTVDGITYKSATAEYYKRAEKWTARGMLGNIKLTVDGPKAPLWLFDTVAICDTTISDSSIAAPTYPNGSVQEPVAQGCTFTMGSFVTPELKSLEFDFGRSIDNPRWDLTQAQGLAGFTPGGYSPTLKVKIASTALVASPFHTSAGLDAYRLQEAANNFGAALIMTGGSYNGFNLSMPQVQVSDVQADNENGEATWTITMVPYNSTPVVQTDIFSIVCGA